MSINEGLDQEMPTGYFFEDGVPAAINNGSVSISKVDDSVTRILIPM